MFEWAPRITILDDMKGNEDKGSEKENAEDKLAEEIVKDISEEEDMEDYAYEVFLISDKSDRNYPGRNIEAEYIISTTEVEIVNYDKSVT